LQNRSSTSAARYLVALCAAAAIGCGGDGQGRAPGPIALDADPVSRGAYVKPLGAAAHVEYARADAAYRRRLIETFTSITPENAMKWEVIHPAARRFDFREADALVRFARRTGKRVRGHPLVWDLQLPRWLTGRDWSRAALRRILRDHIRAVVGRYRGRIAEWDVVNEPLTDAGRFKPTIWYRTLGPGYVALAFRAAHRADPRARLFLNEIDAERAGPKSRALVLLARELKRRGVPIHGIGWQNHTTGSEAAGRARLRALFRAAGRIGLAGAITEMDVGGTDERPQARAYADAARACAAAPNCTGLTVWGVTDRWSWLEPEARALPFDADGEPKPALRALVRPLRR
jgi:endo-1,4-beta-xylanase